jgi:hypothetical protein
MGLLIIVTQQRINLTLFVYNDYLERAICLKKHCYTAIPLHELNRNAHSPLLTKLGHFDQFFFLQFLLVGKVSLAVTKYCVPLRQLNERNIWIGLSGCSGHKAMIPPL